MAKFEIYTKNGHLLSDMRSMLQKAIRRQDYKLAGYAANEMFPKYKGYLWRTLLIISAEDCYGIMTKEIIALKQAEEEFDKRKQDETIFVSKAVVLLCIARKNKDADYFACNLLHSDERIDDKTVQEYVDDFRIEDDGELVGGRIPDWVYSWHTKKGRDMGRDCVDSIIDDQLALQPLQLSLFDDWDWEHHIDKTLDRWNPKGRPHVGIDWSKISDDFR